MSKKLEESATTLNNNRKVIPLNQPLNMDQLSPAIHTDQQRLPCRGCTYSCLNYLTCEGKPWRPKQM